MVRSDPVDAEPVLVKLLKQGIHVRSFAAAL
jgi:hypothetical protein